MTFVASNTCGRTVTRLAVEWKSSRVLKNSLADFFEEPIAFGCVVVRTDWRESSWCAAIGGGADGRTRDRRTDGGPWMWIVDGWSRSKQRKEEVGTVQVARRRGAGDECRGFSVCGGDARPRGPRGNE